MKHLITLLIAILFTSIGFSQVEVDSTYAANANNTWYVKDHPDSVVGTDLLQGPDEAYDVRNGDRYTFDARDSSWNKLASFAAGENGGITGNIAYVSTDGNNSKAEIGNPLRPFADILSAIDSVQATSDTTNVTIYVYSGDYVVDGTGRQVNLTPFDTTTFIHEGGVLTFDNFDDTAEGFGDFINTARDVRDACVANIFLPNTKIIVNATGSASIPIFYGHRDSEVNLEIFSLRQTAGTNFGSRVMRIGAKEINAVFGRVYAQGELFGNALAKDASGENEADYQNISIKCDYFEHNGKPTSSATGVFETSKDLVDSFRATLDIGIIKYTAELSSASGAGDPAIKLGAIDEVVKDFTFVANIGAIISDTLDVDWPVTLRWSHFINSNIDVNIGEVSVYSNPGLFTAQKNFILENSNFNYSVNSVRFDSIETYYGQVSHNVFSIGQADSIRNTNMSFHCGNFNGPIYGGVLDLTGLLYLDSLSNITVSGNYIIPSDVTDVAIESLPNDTIVGNIILDDLMVSGNTLTNFTSPHTFKVLDGVYTNMANNAGDTEEIGTIIYDAAVGDIR